MANENKSTVKPEWEEYYKTLERIRKSGITNMFGAAPYLRELCPELSRVESNEVLANWMNNYDELNEKYGWQ
jgi:hypothetical protein